MMKQTLILAALLVSASAFAPSGRFGVVSHQTALSAEWKPSENWEEKDYESEISKLEKEAEERLDAKIAEMMAKVEVTGTE